ncbi:hypothetical protein D0C36_06960 [Mucilaginibacter conchicola]|uniref:Uncharacterized protein n=1 Tax=Mucilaginibacter conchicola TaxID=2303333 RepID=A0A372NZD4_9SPHI|nr:hypothetical protein [Mucilaginibacter conchicola]RFZ95261.1 hypothetical protein D0C36_06960 [Mucilaginibacter conchicola]
MKKSILATLLAGLILVGIYSFTIVRPTPKKVAVKPKQAFACTAGVTGAHVISNDGWNVTIGWSGTGTVHHYDYGGYYKCSVPSINTTVTYGNQVTIPYQCGGGTLVIRAYCGDGSLGGYQTFVF